MYSSQYGTNLEGGIRGADGAGISIYNSSDRRLKENIVDIPDSLSIISQMKPRNFNWKNTADWDDRPLQYGFIADEWEDVFPGSVDGKRGADGNLIPDALKSDGTIFRQLISVNKKTVPLLVKAVQELLARIEVLEANQ